MSLVIPGLLLLGQVAVLEFEALEVFLELLIAVIPSLLLFFELLGVLLLSLARVETARTC
jgi:hypothetical protein